jgi:hypothetical protein
MGTINRDAIIVSAGKPLMPAESRFILNRSLRNRGRDWLMIGLNYWERLKIEIPIRK